MRTYKAKSWGFEIWLGDSQIGAAVGCWPAAIDGYKRVPCTAWLMRDGGFTEEDLMKAQ